MGKHLPYAIRIEPVRGCNRRCPFCSLRMMPWKDSPYVYMEEVLFFRIVDELRIWRPKGRLDLDQRGEPSLHPSLLRLLAYTREQLPATQIAMFTNCDQLDILGEDKFRDWLHELFDAGLNVAILDCYTTRHYDWLTKMGLPGAIDFYKGKFNPYQYQNPKLRVPLIVDATPRRIDEAGGSSRFWRYLMNQAGNVDVDLATHAGYKIATQTYKGMCSQPFNDMVLQLDDTGARVMVPICCEDWSQELIVGCFPDVSLESLWWQFDPYRRILIEEGRTALNTCAKCSNPPFRASLNKTWFD